MTIFPTARWFASARSPWAVWLSGSRALMNGATFRCWYHANSCSTEAGSLESHPYRRTPCVPSSACRTGLSGVRAAMPFVPWAAGGSRQSFRASPFEPVRSSQSPVPCRGWLECYPPSTLNGGRSDSRKGQLMPRVICRARRYKEETPTGPMKPGSVPNVSVICWTAW